MTRPVDDVDDEFLQTAGQAMRSTGGMGALDALGWWDLLGNLEDADVRSAVFSVFRAQGRELADSPALGAVLAVPFLEGTAAAPGSVTAVVRRSSTRRGPIWTMVGDPGHRQLLFADPTRGAFVIERDAVDLRPVHVPGRLQVFEATVDLSKHASVVAPEELRGAIARSMYLGRVAVALEILGTAERAVDLAVEYAGNREQFGQPIGGFQAVRHLLAWATTDCVAIDAVARKALLLIDHPPAHFDEALKALAGRNGRRACERSLQVLGGIGFTAEHPHHHHHSRVLLLDSILGTATELSCELGAWLRTSGRDPGFAQSLVTAG